MRHLYGFKKHNLSKKKKKAFKGKLFKPQWEVS